jgi:AcrR family transcriptional regulator
MVDEGGITDGLRLKRRTAGERSADEQSVDGRRRRSQRSRERILDSVERAILDLDADTAVTPEIIAAGAGVSVSTFFRHFGDLDALAHAMRKRVAARMLPYLKAGPFEGDTRARVRELLRRRSAIYEIAGPLQRASLRQPRRSRHARASHERFVSVMREQITAALAPELRDDRESAQIVEALLSMGTWTHLRIELQLDVNAAVALTERAVLTQLNARPR